MDGRSRVSQDRSEKTILLLEDDENLNRGIAMRLEKEGYQVLPAFGMSQAVELMRRHDVHLVITDITLKDGSGIDFCRWVRAHSHVYLIFLSALDQEIDIVNGYDLGADDYITKPFSLMVLRARVERTRKRMRGQAADPDQQEHPDYRDERYQFNFQEMTFLVDGDETVLSKTDQKLLRQFTRHPDQILSRDRLLEAVWADGGCYVDENALSVAVNRLRRRLEGREKTCPIQTVYGLGYVWRKKNA